MGSVVLLFLLSLSSWFTVHSCYSMFYRRQDCYYDGGVAGTCVESNQPLLNAAPPPSGRCGGRGPAPPPGHPNGSAYPQYYPPHHQTRALPSAPPNGSLYPQLSNA